MPACPLMELRYFRVSGSDEFGSLTTSSLTLPVGVALAHAFPVSANVTVTPHVTPQFLMRFSSSGDGEDGQQHGPEQHGLSDTDTGFGLRKGLVIGIRRFYGGLDVEFTSLENSGTVYRTSFGIRF